MNAGVGLSVVAPVYNEARVLPELAARCAAAALKADPTAEVLLVDDASTDDTPAVSAALSAPVRVLRLAKNRRQFGATQAGLAAAQGALVVVLDGDLQDPPEHLTALVARLRAEPDLDVVFATKRSRDDPWWFLLGRAAYAALLALPGARAVPPGAGAFCVMRQRVAQTVAALDLPDANLAPVLIALGVRYGTVDYAKAARYDGVSRVGPLGLIAEAVPSLALTGALTSLCRVTAAITGVVGVVSPTLRAPCWAIGLAFGVIGEVLNRRAQQILSAAQHANRSADRREPGVPP